MRATAKLMISHHKMKMQRTRIRLSLSKTMSIFIKSHRTVIFLRLKVFVPFAVKCETMEYFLISGFFFTDLLHCTEEPNVSIPSLANLLIERTQSTNWIVVFKSLVTTHHLMCYGNEVFRVGPAYLA